jgi:heat shock protein HtpX
LYGLAEDELEGVLAHEISHVASGDMRVMNAARAMRSLTRSLASVAWFLLLLSLLTLGALQISVSAMLLMASAPLLSYLAELGLSRTREFGADLAAARLTGRPTALARALVKLERHHRGLLARLLGGNVTLNLPTALRTHPLTEARVRRLLALGPDSPPISRSGAPPLASDRVAAPDFSPQLLANPAHGAHSPGRTTRWSVTMI